MKPRDTLRSYGAMKRKQPGIYKHFIRTGFMVSMKTLLRNKELDACHTETPKPNLKHELHALH